MVAVGTAGHRRRAGHCPAALVWCLAIAGQYRGGVLNQQLRDEHHTRSLMIAVSLMVRKYRKRSPRAGRHLRTMRDTGGADGQSRSSVQTRSFERPWHRRAPHTSTPMGPFIILMSCKTTRHDRFCTLACRPHTSPPIFPLVGAVQQATIAANQRGGTVAIAKVEDTSWPRPNRNRRRGQGPARDHRAARRHDDRLGRAGHRPTTAWSCAPTSIVPSSPASIRSS